MSDFPRVWEDAQKIGGFFTRDESEAIYDAACRLPYGQMIVEVGSYKGRSTTVLARSGRDVWTIDPMTIGFEDGACVITEDIASTLAKNLSAHENVTFKQCTSTTVHDPQSSVGLLLIDGDRRAPWPLKDFTRFERHLSPTARIVFHEYTTHTDVRAAVDSLVSEGRIRIMRVVGSLAMCMRTGVGKGQRGEDAFVKSYFGGKTGRFLDVGAWDGVDKSNVRSLAETGWSGVCIEPAVEPFSALMYNYEGFENVELVHAAIMMECGLSKFWNTADALSSFSPKHVQLWRDKAGVPFRQMWVPHVTFQHLLESLPGPYDFVSLDAEGFSVELLKMLDPVRIGTRLVCVENDGRIPEVRGWCNTFGFKEVHKTEENVLMGRST